MPEALLKPDSITPLNEKQILLQNPPQTLSLSSLGKTLSLIKIDSGTDSVTDIYSKGLKL